MRSLKSASIKGRAILGLDQHQRQILDSATCACIYPNIYLLDIVVVSDLQCLRRFLRRKHKRNFIW